MRRLARKPASLLWVINPWCSTQIFLPEIKRSYLPTFLVCESKNHCFYVTYLSASWKPHQSKIHEKIFQESSVPFKKKLPIVFLKENKTLPKLLIHISSCAGKGTCISTDVFSPTYFVLDQHMGRWEITNYVLFSHLNWVSRPIYTNRLAIYTNRLQHCYPVLL